MSNRKCSFHGIKKYFDTIRNELFTLRSYHSRMSLFLDFVHIISVQESKPVLKLSWNSMRSVAVLLVVVHCVICNMIIYDNRCFCQKSSMLWRLEALLYFVSVIIWLWVFCEPKLCFYIYLNCTCFRNLSSFTWYKDHKEVIYFIFHNMIYFFCMKFTCPACSKFIGSSSSPWPPPAPALSPVLDGNWEVVTDIMVLLVGTVKVWSAGLPQSWFFGAQVVWCSAVDRRIIRFASLLLSFLTAIFQIYLSLTQ